MLIKISGQRYLTGYEVFFTQSLFQELKGQGTEVKLVCYAKGSPLFWYRALTVRMQVSKAGNRMRFHQIQHP